MEAHNADITILVAPFGFGSLGKGLAIAEEFMSCGYSVKVLCDPVAQKVVEASGIPTDSYEYRETLDLDDLHTGAVVSSGDIGTPVVRGRTPFVVVDSLFWLRGKWERLPSSDADAYIAQRFFIEPTKEARMAIGDRLIFVDAILPYWAQNSTAREPGELVVVYPGGMRSPVLTQEYQEAYLSWVTDTVTEAIRRADIDKDKLVAVIPPQLLSSAPTHKLALYGKIVPAGVNVIGGLLEKARCLVVAPGIETMLEACAMGLAPHYLPAYNGSHIPQLIAYRKAGVGDEICPSYAKEIQDFEAETDWLNKLTVDLSKKNLQSLSQPRFKEEAISNLTNILRDKEKLIPKYPLGKFGARQIVDIVESLIRTSKTSREAELLSAKSRI